LDALGCNSARLSIAILMEKNMQEKLLPMKAVADILGLHYRRVQRAVKRGDLPSYSAFGKQPRLLLSDVEKYVQFNKRGGEK
jgi:excisionase family DNA binding protein